MPAKKDPLARYKKMRDFKKTPEPSGGKASLKLPIFVVQKHDATRLHYDFRLESNGVLLSWACPKGPSFDPTVRRLAMRTEDHPMDYADFEGNIPEGEYGGGPVIVWDRGHYVNVSQKSGKPISMDDALAKGHVNVWLEGEKLKGGFSLVRLRAEKGKEPWLLIKSKDPQADPKRDPVAKEPRSVISGKTVEEIGALAKKPAAKKPAARKTARAGK